MTYYDLCWVSEVETALWAPSMFVIDAGTSCSSFITVSFDAPHNALITHFKLQLYDDITNELIDRALVKWVRYD